MTIPLTKKANDVVSMAMQMIVLEHGLPANAKDERSVKGQQKS
jgi:hypothetical protein